MTTHARSSLLYIGLKELAQVLKHIWDIIAELRIASVAHIQIHFKTDFTL